MDRLHTVRLAGLAAALAAAACSKGGEDKKQEPAAESASRVDVVQAGAEKQVTVEEFCDVHPASASAAPALTVPPLAEGQSAPAKGSWRWVNVWATWCKPCIEEMPALARWQKELSAQGTKFDLVFVSADDSEDRITRFREKHPDAPPSLRLADPDALPKWLGALGLGEAAPIPVHVFVDPEDRVRCVRAGGVKERDLSAVRAILGAS